MIKHPVTHTQELWCKKVPPSTSQFSHCRHNHPSLPDTDPQPPPLPNRQEVARLLATADEIGLLLQNQHQGFLPNKRQQRMGGLAAIELAQAVRHLVSPKSAVTRCRLGSSGVAQWYADQCHVAGLAGKDQIRREIALHWLWRVVQ